MMFGAVEHWPLGRLAACLIVTAACQGADETDYRAAPNATVESWPPTSSSATSSDAHLPIWPPQPTPREKVRDVRGAVKTQAGGSPATHTDHDDEHRENELMAAEPQRWTPEPGGSIRAKWVMDDAATLAEAADRLEAFAADLRRLAAAGWTLEEPIADDYGTLVGPAATPYCGHCDGAHEPSKRPHVERIRDRI